jgi:hypothetical protein
MKTALLVIALGCDYRPYLNPLLDSANRFFIPHTPFVWTDDTINIPYEGVRIDQRDLGWPQSTLQRYRMFTQQAHRLKDFDQLFYCDVDMRFVAPVSETDVCSPGITATRHPGFMVDGRMDESGCIVSVQGTREYRTSSLAAMPRNACNDLYFCGGFNGGDAKTFLAMSDLLRHNITVDLENEIIAKWHDESHLNHYLYYNPPAKILTPSFCYPENYRGQWGWAPDEYKPVLIALNKAILR